MQRRRVKYAASLADRIAIRIAEIKAKAEALPEGAERARGIDAQGVTRRSQGRTAGIAAFRRTDTLTVRAASS
jgi:hypothetical protein